MHVHVYIFIFYPKTLSLCWHVSSLDPNSLIFSFSSGASLAHNASRRVFTIIQPTDISHEKSWQLNVMARWSSLIISHCGRFFWMLCTRQRRFLVLHLSLCSWRLLLMCLTSLICANKNNGNKFYHKICVGGRWETNNQQIGALLCNHIPIGFPTVQLFEVLGLAGNDMKLHAKIISTLEWVSYPASMYEVVSILAARNNLVHA